VRRRDGAALARLAALGRRSGPRGDGAVPTLPVRGALALALLADGSRAARRAARERRRSVVREGGASAVAAGPPIDATPAAWQARARCGTIHPDIRV